MKNFISLSVGFIFALGLGFSGMTKTHVVKGFLDVFGKWDYRLIGVMIGAIGVHAISYYLIRKRTSPLLEKDFLVPTNSVVDKKLIIGAVLFGLGWGWAGICPGPGIVSILSGDLSFLYFILSMLVGMKIFQLTDKKLF
jgi:uncharacterized membrane protein YedE/YeeE